VVTRALQFELNHRLKGLAKMYVDDVCMVTSVKWVDRDQAMVYRLVEGLFG
jgi:hypothetical protein